MWRYLGGDFLQIKRLFKGEIGLFWRSLFADFFKSMTIVQFCSFKWIFLRPALTVNLFKTPVVGQFTRKTTPADGREKYGSSPLIHSFYEEKIWAQLEGVNASAV
jgi:hypothetical protein